MKICRVIVVSFLVLSFVGAPHAQAPSDEPIGTLAQLMRGIMFPNSNKLFDLQSQAPGSELPEMSSEVREAVAALVGPATARFGGVYRGWPDVEGAAVALADSAKLAMMEGRLCDNGMPAPVDQADYIEGARLLEESALTVLEAAQNQDYDAASFAVNFIVESCSHCHRTYRDGPDSRQEPRCQ
tara:strand:- start:816 stop:1367 length:552 start_codon:yes stop_codon:yes gene_type:complete